MSQVDEALLAHYNLEKQLASQLMKASNEERRELYGKVYTQLYQELRKIGRESVIEQNSSAQVQLCLPLIQSFIPDGAVFVEFGAGNGKLTAAVAKSLKTRLALAIDGVENAPPNPDSNMSDKITTPDSLVTTLDGDKIDLAFSCHFVEHLHPEDMDQHLQEVSALLAPDGCYILITPNRLLGPHDVSKDFDDVPTGLHLKEYTHGDLVRLLKSHDYRNVRIPVQKKGQWSERPTMPFTALETLLKGIPRRLRARLLETIGNPAPFRALEQVVVVASHV